jgi:putative FmdB family regulatory protein
MPIYEYACRKCGHKFEKREGFHDNPGALCPECQGKAKRVFHPAPIIFKGKGFYVTDHRKGTDSEGGAAKKDSKAEPAKKETKSEAPASKSASESTASKSK